jgi:hypothetical protein
METLAADGQDTVPSEEKDEFRDLLERLCAMADSAKSRVQEAAPGNPDASRINELLRELVGANSASQLTAAAVHSGLLIRGHTSRASFDSNKRPSLTGSLHLDQDEWSCPPGSCS